MFVQDREARTKLIESEKLGGTTLIQSMHAYLSRKQSRIANSDPVIDSVLNLLFALTTNTEQLPVVISKTHSTGIHVLLEYMRLTTQADVRATVLKTLLNISRCSDDASIGTLSGAGGMKHLTEMLLNIFKRPSASTDDMHLSISVLFNLRHMIKTDASTKGFLLHSKEDEYRDRLILTSRIAHCDPVVASTRLICLKFISFLLEICQQEDNPKCLFSISFKLLAPKSPTGAIQQSFVDIANLPAVQPKTAAQASVSPADTPGQAVVSYGDFVMSDIERPLMEGAAERLADIEKAISQHACLVMCTIFCSSEPKLEDVVLKISEINTKLHLPIISHITEASCSPVVVRACKALACMSRSTKYTQIVSDPCIIIALLALLEQPATLKSFSQIDLRDILAALRGFANNPTCVPHDGDVAHRMVGVLSRLISRSDHMQHAATVTAALEILEQISQRFEAFSLEVDAVRASVAAKMNRSALASNPPDLVDFRHHFISDKVCSSP
jgi:hypothetical protein